MGHAHHDAGAALPGDRRGVGCRGGRLRHALWTLAPGCGSQRPGGATAGCRPGGSTAKPASAALTYNPNSLNAAAEAELQDSLGPITRPPGPGPLRNQLLALLTPPETLQITLAGQEILIGADDRTARRYSPGEPHARVDAFGTATIKTALTPGKLTITERYDRKREYLETYAVLRTDGTLVVTRTITRPGIKPLLLRSVYRPG